MVEDQPTRRDAEPIGDTPPSTGEVSRLLAAWRGGDAAAVDRLLPLVYDELRSLSRRYLRRERADHTLQSAALVHEAYLRLVGKDHPQLRDRMHFLALAAQQMRRVLVDHARAHAAGKRGGGVEKLDLDDTTLAAGATFGAQKAEELLALDTALAELAELDPRKAHIVELRYFGGLDLAECAEVLGVSTSTVNNETRLARAWLHRRLAD